MNAAWLREKIGGCVAARSRLTNLRRAEACGGLGLPTRWLRDVLLSRRSAAGLALAYCLVTELPSRGVTFPQYSSHLWQTENGLPNEVVNCICQTRDGYLWVGTRRGLARFNGVVFDVLDSPEAPPLQKTSITALCQTRDGSLWIGTWRYGLVRLKDGKFLAYGRAQGLVGESVQVLKETSDGALWVGTTDGLSCWQNGKFTNFTTADGLHNSSVSAISEDSRGTLWITTPVALQRIQDGRITEGPHWIGGVLRSVLAAADGALWLGASQIGAGRFKDGRYTLFCTTNGLPDNLFTTVYPDRQGRMWIGTLGGLSCISAGDKVNEIKWDSVSFPPVNTVFEDQEGNLWVGTMSGLYRLNPRVFASYTKADGLSHNIVMSLREDQAGTMWVATWGGGVNLLQAGKFTPLTALNRVCNNFALSLCAGRSGGMWVGMDYSGGLFYVKENQIEQFGAARGLTDPAVAVVCEDHQGNTWLGTRTALVRLRDGQFTRYTRKEGLPADKVRAILPNRKGGLWIGTTGGLSYMANGHFRNFGLENGLSHTNISALYEDAAGDLWVGTDGGGLNRIRQNRICSWRSSNGLHSDQIFEILEDQFGFLWLSSLQGVFRVARTDLDAFAAGTLKTVPCTAYGRPQGMPSPQCNNVAKPAAWKTSDGRLWFATITGLAVVDPSASPQISTAAPPIRVERLLVDGKNVLLQGAVRVPPNLGDLEIHYAALSFRLPEHNRFKYKLEGVDPEWVDAGTRREAYYSHRAPGNYCFRVIGCNADGIWNELGAELQFALLPHFWQTWWFRLALATTIGLVLSGGYAVRRAQQRQLEKLRTRIAADLHDELSSNIGGISLLSRLMQQTAASKEQLQDLALIHRIAAQTADSIKDIVWFTNPGNDTAQDLLARLQDVANTLLTGVECDFHGHLKNPAARISLDFRRNLFLVFKETIANIVKHANASRVNITLAETAGQWQLQVQDDGIGFKLDTATQGNGLKNLQRRAQNINGELEIHTAPGQGTTVTFTAMASGHTQPPVRQRKQEGPQHTARTL